MGQYHILVNLTKNQFVHPHQIGNGLKLYEQVGWEHSTATVLVMLLAASCGRGGRGGGDFQSKSELIGSWAGDQIALIGDYAEAKDVKGCNAKVIYDCCRAAVYPDAKDIKRPKGWKSWTNISAKVRVMMSEEFGVKYEGEGWMQIVDPKDAKQ